MFVEKRFKEFPNLKIDVQWVSKASSAGIIV